MDDMLSRGWEALAMKISPERGERVSYDGL